jgi:hypothetical protein
MGLLRRVSVLLVLLSGVLVCRPVSAGLKEDAEAALNRLQQLGDPDRTSATSGATAARQAAREMWPNLESGLLAWQTRITTLLAEARQKWNAWTPPAGVTKPAAPDFARADAKLAAVTAALSDIRSVHQDYRTRSETEMTSAVNDAVSATRGNIDAAKNALRGLLPAPVGNRPAMVKSRCQTAPKVYVDCNVPNSPPSDAEFRSAIANAQQAAEATTRMAAIATVKYADRMRPTLDKLVYRVFKLESAMAEAMRVTGEMYVQVLKWIINGG